MKRFVQFFAAAMLLLPLSTFAQDVGVTAIVKPTTCGSRSQRVVVKIKNYAAFARSNIPVTVEVTGAGSATVNGTYSKSLAAGAEDTLGIASGLNTASGGVYTVKAYTTLSGDVNSTNDGLTKLLSLNAIPTAAFTANKTTVCNNSAVTFTNTSTGGSTYKWYFGDGTTSTAVSPTHVYNKTGTRVVSLVTTSSNTCSDSTALIINVLPNPGGAKIVEGNPFTGYFYAGTPNDPDLTCVKDTLTYEILPPSDFQNSSYGTNWTLSYSLKTTGGQSTSNHTFTAPSSSNNGKITFIPDASNGGYTYLLVVAVKNQVTNCDSTLTHYLTVNNSPIADFTYTGQCVGEPTAFKDNSNTPPGLVVRRYDFGVGNAFSTTANPNYTYTQPGTYTVKYTVTSLGGCDDVITKTITIYGKPTADFSVNSACAGNQADILDKSTASTGTTITRWKWTFDNNTSDTASGPVPKKTFATPGTHTVKLQVWTGGGCMSEVTKTINVAPGPTADFPDPAGCLKQDIKFINNSQNAVNYIWRFSDGEVSTEFEPTRKFMFPSTYRATLVAISNLGCRDSVTKVISFYPEPDINYSYSPACAGQPINFTDNSTVPDGGSVFKWEWKFDGKPATLNSKTVSHTFTTAGNHQVVLRITTNKGCVDSVKNNIYVHPAPVASFNPPASICLDQDAQFTNTTSGAGNLYTWAFGDGDSSELANPKHAYKAVGNYKVTLIVENANGCKATTFKNISVTPSPSPSFTFKVSKKVVAFTVNNTNYESYHWDFGDGNTRSNDMNPFHGYNAAHGKYLVTLTVTDENGCVGTFSDSVGTGIFAPPTSAIEEGESAERFGLAVYPNPSSRHATIIYNLEKSAKVNISIYDVVGKEIAVVADERQSPGRQEVKLDAKEYGLQKGVYFIRVNADGRNYVTRLIYKD